MPLVDINFRPPERQLRQFGLIGAWAVPVWAWWWGASGNGLLLTAGICAGLGLVGWLQPRLLKWPFVGLSLITWPIGAVIGELVLLVIYFGIVTPLGFFFRWRGRDVLHLRPDPQAETYWQQRPPPRPPRDYYRQF